MSSFSYLQPNLMSTEELRNHLKLRFPNQNVSELQRDDLLKLYSMYAIPKARRIKGNEDVEMKAATEPIVRRDNEHKRSRHHLITAPTVETVTNACKKIRLINTDGIGLNGTRAINTQEVVNTKCMGLNNKRQCEPEPMESDESCPPTQSKRKKITWP